MTMRDRLRALDSLNGSYPAFETDAAPDDPRELFIEWLGAAIEAEIAEAHAMTLSTVDRDGCPDARVLILKNVDEDGWHFATMRTTPKGRQVYANPHVALTFYWPKLGRQVRVRGLALEVDQAARDTDFRARTFEARARGMVGRQSEVLASDKELIDSVAEATALLKDDPTAVPPNWGVYVVHPQEVEFWQADSERLHIRLRYRQAEGSSRWLRERLWP